MLTFYSSLFLRIRGDHSERRLAPSEFALSRLKAWVPAFAGMPWFYIDIKYYGNMRGAAHEQKMLCQR
jgi:hypothetical protein